MDDEELKMSVIGKDFLCHTKHPDIDMFLDYRLALKDGKWLQKYMDVPKAFFKYEILAVDEIIKRLTGGK